MKLLLTQYLYKTAAAIVLIETKWVMRKLLIMTVAVCFSVSMFGQSNAFGVKLDVNLMYQDDVFDYTNSATSSKIKGSGKTKYGLTLSEFTMSELKKNIYFIQEGGWGIFTTQFTAGDIRNSDTHMFLSFKPLFGKTVANNIIMLQAGPTIAYILRGYDNTIGSYQLNKKGKNPFSVGLTAGLQFQMNNGAIGVRYNYEIIGRDGAYINPQNSNETIAINSNRNFITLSTSIAKGKTR